jgi:hypothetical protein
VILADLLRRAGRLEEGRELCARVLRGSLDGLLTDLIELEPVLIEQNRLTPSMRST